MIHQKFIEGYLNYLKSNHPIPDSTKVDILYHQPVDFPAPTKYPNAEGLCHRLKPTHYRLDVKVSKHRHTTCFRLGHEYKHVLQFCYEGMRSDDKTLKGLGYHYWQWEIPANYFARDTLAAYKATLK